jgi:hypothetical protein
MSLATNEFLSNLKSKMLLQTNKIRMATMFKFKQNTAGQKKNVLQITQPASQQKNIR